jgi:hypothetical protein
VAAFLLAYAGMAETAHRDEAKQQLAIRAAAREVLDSLQELTALTPQDTALLTDELQRLMLSNVKQHQTLGQSRDLCRERLRESRRARVVELLDGAALRASELSPLGVAREHVVQRLGPDWEKQKDEVVGRFVEQHFEPIVTAARSAAVMTQRAKIEQSVQYPAFEELDVRLTELAPDVESARTPLDRETFGRLQPWIQSLIFAGGEPFEENQPAIKQLGEDVLSRLRSQYDRQIAVVRELAAKDAVPADCIVRGTIETFLANALTEAVRGLKPEGGVPVYLPLTAVKNYTTSQAVELEKKRLLAFIALPETVTIERADIEKRIAAEPSAHRDAAASQGKLVTVYVDQFHRPVAERYAARSASPAVNQIDLLLLGHEEISKAFTARITAILKQELPPLRAAFAKRQFETTFPALNARKEFTEPMIEFLHDGQTPQIGALKLLTELLVIEPDHAPRPHQSGDLLAETQKLALEAANALAGPKVKALGAQLRLVAELEKEKAAELRRDVIDGKSFEAIKKIWQKEMEQRWKQQSAETTGAAPALFARTESQLDKTVRQLYDAVKAELTQQEAKTAAESDKPATPESEQVTVPEEQKEKPEEEDPEEKLAGMEEELLACKGIADFVMVLSDSSPEKVLMVFGTPADGALTRAEFSPLEVEAAAERIAQAVQAQFTGLLRAKVDSSKPPALLFWRKHAPLIRVLVLEHSRQTRHMTGILLQRKVKDQIRSLTGIGGNVRFDLEWQEGLGIDE